jgi:disulfide bond formation protein DsbB
MNTNTMSEFFAVLSLVVWGASVLTIVLALVHRASPDSAAGLLYEDIARSSLWLAFLVALGTMLGSLYLSEVAHFVPCPLCWYQRICMYPLSVALLVGGLRRDRFVYTYILPPAIIGAAIAIYHTQLQAFPKQSGPFCDAQELCKARYIYEWGFVSIPFMSLSAFTFIIVMMFVLRSNRDAELDPDDDDANDDADALSVSAQGVA